MALPSLSTTARDAIASAREFASRLSNPTIRLGVTGLSRAGKTVFITSLVRNLVAGGRLPFFSPLAEGRVVGAYLEPQPDDRIPRFDYERHLKALMSDPPDWPKSTTKINQLRLTIEYEPAGVWRRVTGRRSLHLDIVDYPGEWLLDLSLLRKSFAQWSYECVELARQGRRTEFSCQWLTFLDKLDLSSEINEEVIIEGARRFRNYLREARSDIHAFCTLPPGRFLMPGELEGSPMLTFFPLDVVANDTRPSTPYQKELNRRYDAYVSHVVTPFYRDHFSRLDRQIVLVDVLGALNAGVHALGDLEGALTSVLGSFNQGKNSFLSSIFRPRIDRILFAATKADHVHHNDHERLEGLLRILTERASTRAEYSGAKVKVLAMAAVRATEEAMLDKGGVELPTLVGTPLGGERLGDKLFDGIEQAAIFPGDLPGDPALALKHGRKDALSAEETDMRFIRFRPPKLGDGTSVIQTVIPHIRLDHVLEFLIGDRI